VPPPEPPSLAPEWLGTVGDLRDEWSRLAARTGNVFSSWEWARVWLDHRGGDAQPRLLGLRRPDGELAGILPLTFARKGPLRVGRIVGHGPADQLGPICAAEDRAAVAAAIAAAGRDLGALFVGDRLDSREGWAGRLGARVVRREPSPVLALEGRGWEDYLAGRSSNFRSQVRRAERKLVRDHALSFRLSDTPERLEEDFDTLVALHRARWGAESQSFDDGLEDFHRDFARVALERGWLRLWVAEAAGTPVAAWLGFRYAAAESFYQAGRDPEWERSKIGFVLLAHTIRAAFEDGLREYRFLRGGESYKSRFTDSDADVETVALGHGALASLAVAGGARAAGSPRGRRLLAGLAG